MAGDDSLRRRRGTGKKAAPRSLKFFLGFGFVAALVYRLVSDIGSISELGAAEKLLEKTFPNVAEERSLLRPPPNPSAGVSCGGHTAATCDDCVSGGKGSAWCNGDCSWCDHECQLGKCYALPTSPRRPAAAKKAPVVDKKLPCSARFQFDCVGDCEWCGQSCQSKGRCEEEARLSQRVSCGGHYAATCEKCVEGGHGAGWCNGECEWCGSSCRGKGACGKLPVASCEATKDCWEPPAAEPWFTAHEKRYGGNSTLSVVLPCGFEHEYFERTAKSVVAATPHDVLKEVVIIDDASKPPLEFEQSLEKTKIVRHDGPPLGLIGAKQLGAESAEGDIVVFLDCHVKPAVGWWEPILREIAENPKRVVVPTITHLNADTWKESGRPTGIGGLSKCYLTLDGQFKWTNDNTKWVPIMSGGLLAISKKWFFEVGGHDKGMKGWGGENLDLSLRIWRCGGEIVSAPRSYVAHMFRDAKHKAKYTVQANDVSKNLATAMMGHTNEYFLQKTITFPGFEKYQTSQDSLNLDSIREPTQTCNSFQWYLDRFSYIYRDAGVIPEEVFQLSPDGGQNCLQITPSRPWGNAKQPTDQLMLMPCKGEDKGSNQWWHGANRSPDGKCCTGLRVWNTDQCLANGATTICNLDGTKEQFAELDSNGILRLNDNFCFSSDLIISHDCKNGTWSKMNAFTPVEFALLDENTKARWRKSEGEPI